jgi:hypothetical protein
MFLPVFAPAFVCVLTSPYTSESVWEPFFFAILAAIYTLIFFELVEEFWLLNQKWTLPSSGVPEGD